MSTELRIKTEMPSPHRMNQLIAICDKAACDESAEYVLAATLTGAADEAGIAPDGDDFETRCNQRKMFMGRVIELIRERGLVSPQPAPDAEGEWYVMSDSVSISESHGICIIKVFDRGTETPDPKAIAAQIVRDHSAVPKLVEALRAAKRDRIELIGECDHDAAFAETCPQCQIDAALASTQEKQ